MPVQANFLTAIWLFFLAFVLHEVEEWNIDQFEHRNFVGLPPAATDRSARMWIGFVVLIGLIWCTAATLPGNPTIAAWIILPAIAIMLQNALQHVFWVFYFRQYAPGVVTAVLLMIPLGSYVIAMAIEQKHVPIWYIALWTAVIILGFVQTVRAGNKMTPLVRTINNIGIWLSDRIR
jgi:hypothetical protein